MFDLAALAARSSLNSWRVPRAMSTGPALLSLPTACVMAIASAMLAGYLKPASSAPSADVVSLASAVSRASASAYLILDPKSA